MPAISTLTDSFDGAKDTGKWSATTRAVGHTALNGLTEQGSTTQSGGYLVMAPADSVNTAFVGYSSVAQDLDFTGDGMFCRVPTIDSDSISSFHLMVAKASNTTVRWFRGSVLRDGGSNRIEAQLFDGSSDLMPSIAYDPVNHRWLRTRFAGGVWFFDTAPDGVDVFTPGTWTNQYTTRTAVNGMEDGTGMEVGLQAWNINSATGVLWAADQFNLSGAPAAADDLQQITCDLYF